MGIGVSLVLIAAGAILTWAWLWGRGSLRPRYATWSA